MKFEAANIDVYGHVVYTLKAMQLKKSCLNQRIDMRGVYG